MSADQPITQIVPAGSAPDNELTPEFRVVITGERRRGIRLERLFGRLLGEIASGVGRSGRG